VNNLRTAVGAEYQPQATTVAFVEPPVSAAPANHLVATASVPAPASVVAPVAPVPPPAQAVVPQSEETVAVFLHLTSGERIWAGRFASSELADQRAGEIVRALNRPEPGVWAKFGNRLIRPEAVVSIELAQRRED
jgi:hypothetical protein